MKNPSDALQRAEELARQVLPLLTEEPQPDFRERILARAEALASSRRRGFLSARPSWLQIWTPALTMGILLFILTTWMPRPFDQKQTNLPLENGAPRVRGIYENTSLPDLIQKGIRENRDGNTTKAMAIFREAVEYVAYPLNQLAWNAYEQGEAARGLPQARLAVQLSPENSEYLDTLATILCTIGEKEEAVQHVEKAARLSPQDFAAKLVKFRQGICQ